MKKKMLHEWDRKEVQPKTLLTNHDYDDANNLYNFLPIYKTVIRKKREFHRTKKWTEKKDFLEKQKNRRIPNLEILFREEKVGLLN